MVVVPETITPLVSLTALCVLLSRKSKRAYETVDNEQSLSPQPWMRRQHIKNGNRRVNIFFMLQLFLYLCFGNGNNLPKSKYKKISGLLQNEIETQDILNEIAKLSFKNTEKINDIIKSR